MAVDDPINLEALSTPTPNQGGVSSPGAAAAVDDLAELREIMRWGSYANQSVEGRSTDAALKQLLEALKAQGVPQATLDKLSTLKGNVLRGKTLPPGLLKAAGDKAEVVKQQFDLARASVRGIKPKDLNMAFRKVLGTLKEAGVDEGIIAELKQVGPQRIAEVGVAPTLQALGSRGKDYTLASLFYKATGKKPTPQLADKIMMAVKEEGVAAEGIAGAAGALGKAGIRGFTKGSKALRGMGLPGLIIGGLGAAQSIGGLYDMAVGKPSRAHAMAQQGITMEGQRITSADQLRQMLEEKDRLSQRKLVATQREPQLTAQIIQAMIGQKPTPQLTRTEMSVGRQVPGQKIPGQDEISAMLDQLMTEMG